MNKAAIEAIGRELGDLREMPSGQDALGYREKNRARFRYDTFISEAVSATLHPHARGAVTLQQRTRLKRARRLLNVVAMSPEGSEGNAPIEKR